MTYPCSGCGKHACNGRCFTQCEQDFEGDPEMVEPRPAYTPSPEYLAWIADLEPKKRPDGRWEIAA